MSDTIFLGIKGHVVSIRKSDGVENWRTNIKSGQLTNVVVGGNCIYAYSGGHLFCVDANNGRVLWENKLEGLGYGHCIIATEGGQSTVAATAQQISAQSAVIASTAASSSSGNVSS